MITTAAAINPATGIRLRNARVFGTAGLFINEVAKNEASSHTNKTDNETRNVTDVSFR